MRWGASAAPFSDLLVARVFTPGRGGRKTSLPIVGIPASFDNDIGLSREALGVDTALNTIIDACDRITDTARSHHRAFIVEVMGRHSGYLAMAAAVATAADAVLLPEHRRNREEVLTAVSECIVSCFGQVRDKTRVLIIKAEGVEIPTHELLEELGKLLPPDANIEVRGTVLGHLVRGGNPSFRDRLLAGRFGLVAVDAVLSPIEWRVGTSPTPERRQATAGFGFSPSPMCWKKRGHCSTGRVPSPWI